MRVAGELLGNGDPSDAESEAQDEPAVDHQCVLTPPVVLEGLSIGVECTAIDLGHHLTLSRAQGVVGNPGPGLRRTLTPGR